MIPPRFFVINHDNTGFELLEENQIKNYKRLKEADTGKVQIIEGNLRNLSHFLTILTIFPFFSLENNLKNENCDSFTYITKYKSLKEEKEKFINPELPRALDIMPKT